MRIRTKRKVTYLLTLVTWLVSYPLSAQESQGTIDSDGAEIHFRVHGSGPPLLLVHGFFSTGELWSPFVDDLASTYRVIIPDMRGHGRSSNPSDSFLHEQSAKDMLAVLDSLNVGEIQAVGHSSGAMTLIHAAIKEPDRFKSLVLLGGTTHFPETARAIQRGITLEGFPPEILANLRRWHPGGDEQIRRLVTQINQMSIGYRDMNFTAPLLGTISAETLIVHGDRDEHFPVEIALQMYRAIPNAYLWVVPNGNHALPFDVWEGSFPGGQSFVPTLREFLSNEWSVQ